MPTSNAHEVGSNGRGGGRRLFFVALAGALMVARCTHDRGSNAAAPSRPTTTDAPSQPETTTMAVPTTPWLKERTGARLAILSHQNLHVLDVDASTSAPVLPFQPVDHVVVVDGQVLTIQQPEGLDPPIVVSARQPGAPIPVPFAMASSAFPSAIAGRVWLVGARATTGDGRYSIGTTREYDLSGRPTSPPYRLVNGGLPLADTGAGLITVESGVDTTPWRLDVWHPALGTTRTVTADGHPVGLRGRWLVWTSNPDRADVVHVMNVVTGASRSVRLSEPVGLNSAALDPAGGRLAAQQWDGPMAIIDLRSGHVTTSTFTLTDPFVPPVWSRDGRWVFVAGAHPDRLVALDTGIGTSHDLPVDASDITELAAW